MLAQIFNFFRFWLIMFAVGDVIYLLDLATEGKKQKFINMLKVFGVAYGIFLIPTGIIILILANISCDILVFWGVFILWWLVGVIYRIYFDIML